MPSPKEVFDDPLEYLDFLQSADFEGQLFERKEVRIETNNQINTLKEKIKQCISAFANSNRADGLVVLGVANDGTIKGTQHVDEQTINNILQVTWSLSNHTTQVQEVELPNSDGKRLYLLYTPWVPNAICETIGNFPQSWKRVGAQNLALTEQDREQLKRDKKIVDFEMSYCCPYDPDELDEDIVEEFKREFLESRDAQYDDHSTEDVLLNIGAIRKSDNDEHMFTKAGYLFFTKDPRKYLPGAYVRVLRFEVNVEESGERGVTTFDKDFNGALPSIVRKLRTFFRDSALFRTIIRRSTNGGFIEDPEYPLLAVDEAIVNAVIHRDYEFSEAIHCIAYRNGLAVQNPGGILQQVPKSFSLADTVLISVLRNPRIVDWMRLLKDERGEPLVRALTEGTRTMRQEMENLGLPAPHYDTDRNTTVTLYNRLEERLDQHAYTHTKETRNNTPATSSQQGNTGKIADFIEEHLSQTGENGNKMNTNLTDLPQSWIWTTIQEVCSTPQYGWTTKAATHGTLRLLRTTDITAGKVNWETVPFCQEEPPDKEKYLLKTGDIVISRAGSVGYSHLVENPQDAVFASYLIRFKPSPIIKENFLAFFLKSPDYWKIISKEKAGIALVNVNATKLKRIEVPLPPLAEQRRIVTKLETLFTQLDAAVDSLKKAQTQLQRYRQSVLKAAFEGELTKKCCERYSDSWESMNLNEFITLESGSRPKGGVRGILEGIPSLGGEHLNADGGFNFEKIKYIPEVFFESLNNGRIRPNDIIVVKDGATTGKTSFVDNDFPHEHAAVNEHLFIVRVDAKVAFPKFVFYYLYSSKGQQQILSDFRGATVGGISRNFPLKVNVPIPSLTEQEWIISEIERHLAIADSTEATIESELARAERLRQSILKQAFSGKLVPQDPNDEPASSLLEQIKEENSRQQSKRNKSTTKAKTTPPAKQVALPLN